MDSSVLISVSIGLRQPFNAPAPGANPRPSAQTSPSSNTPMSFPGAVPSPKNHFDELSFLKYMKYIGRAYRRQAMTLISICRDFVQQGEMSILQDGHLRRVLEVADDALISAADSKNKTSVGADKRFEEAINALSAYVQKYHPELQDVAIRMKDAKKYSSNVSEILKKSFQAKPVEGPTKVVQFLLPDSLPDRNPTVVEQVIGKETSVDEVLWNFSRLKGRKRITLKQNPHFYKGLPRSALGYSDEFITEPIQNFWDVSGEDIWILTDERSRVFLETDEMTRAFGNFWVPHEAIIFKDISGRLVGEGIVGKDIRGTPHLWHREEPTIIPPLVRRSTTGPVIPSHLPPLLTNPVRGRVFEDWRQLVRDTLKFPNISVHISTKGTPPDSEDDWVLTNPDPDLTPDTPTQSFPITQSTPISGDPLETFERLEEERILTANVRGTLHLSHREDSVPSATLPPMGRPNLSSLPPIITNRTFEDWRQLARNTDSPNVSARTSTEDTPTEYLDNWAPPSSSTAIPDSPAPSFSTMQSSSTDASGATAIPQRSVLRSLNHILR
ncbi:hypothetical protein EDB85DRAFT_1950035, partial [Lactarius pseudohatsudake]